VTWNYLTAFLIDIGSGSSWANSDLQNPDHRVADSDPQPLIDFMTKNWSPHLSHPEGELEWFVAVQRAVKLLAAGQLARVMHRQLIPRVRGAAALGWAGDHLPFGIERYNHKVISCI